MTRVFRTSAARGALSRKVARPPLRRGAHQGSHGLIARAVTVLVVAVASSAQEAPRRVPDDGVEYRTRIWRTDDGLPQSSVTCITETSDTYLWVGTFGGLARFGGASLQEVDLTESDGVGSVRFLTLYEDPRTRSLWLGTLGGGILRRCGLRSEHFGRAEGLPGESVYGITNDADGRLWVATEGGVAWFDEARFRPLPHTALQGARALARCGGGVVVATSSGMFALSVDGPQQISEFPAEHIVEDGAGRLWCSGARRLRVRDDGTWRDLDIDGPPGLQITALGSDRAGGVWLGTNCGAVRLAGLPAAGYGLDLSMLSPPRDRAAAVQAIYEDHDGSVWIGWSMFGLQRVRAADTSGVRIRARPELAEVFVVAEHPSGGLWLGGRGLARWHDGEIERVPTPGVEVTEVRALLPETDGALWLADTEAVYRLHGEAVDRFGLECGLPRTPKRALLRTAAGSLWVGSDRGLFAQRGGAFERVAAEAVTGSVAALARAEDDVWVGGPGLLVRLHSDGSVAADLRGADRIPPVEVRTLLPMANGSLWVVTYGAGLLLVSEGQVRRVDNRKGLVDDALCAAIVDGDDLCVSSNHGLFRCALAELDSVARGGSARIGCQRLVGSPLVATEGAGGNQPSACRDESGRLWFVTIDGLSGVDPAHLRRPPPVPRCGVQAVVAGDDYYEPVDDVELRPGVRSVSIRLGTTGFDPIVPPRFAWRLLPGAAEWQELASGCEVHLELSPGDHRFEARSANWIGDWSSATTLRLVVPELLTERSWFRVVGVLAFAALCTGLMLFGSRRGASRSRRLAREVEARTAQLSAEIEQHRTTAAQLQSTRDELEERVRQRTDELVRTWQQQRQELAERERLEVRMQQLQRLDNVGDLAGGIAHDFNDLLTVVLGSATLLQRSLHGNVDANVLLDEILTACNRGGLLTQQLLMLVSRQVVAKTVLDINEVVENAGPTLRRVLGDGIELAIGTAPQPMRVLAATAQIEQILINLADNARRAMPGGGRLQIDVQPCRGVDGADCVRLRIADSGVGMSPEVRERAFDPFFSTRAEAGAGLGLAAVSAIVRQLGGSVSLDSVVAGGTTVEILLPLTGVEAIGSEPPAPQVPATGPILLVEDDRAVRSVVAMLLERLGYRVDSAASGEDAVAMLEQASGRYSVILSDLMMPGLHGIDLVRALRAAAPAAALVFMSGCWELLDTHEELLGPILSKPPSVDALRQAIEHSMPRQANGV